MQVVGMQVVGMRKLVSCKFLFRHAAKDMCSLALYADNTEHHA